MWRISKENLLSDHRCVKFEWFSERGTAKSVRNCWHMNWELYRTMLAQELYNRDLNFKSVAYVEAIRMACESSCSMKMSKESDGRLGGRGGFRNSLLGRAGRSIGPTS